MPPASRSIVSPRFLKPWCYFQFFTKFQGKNKAKTPAQLQFQECKNSHKCFYFLVVRGLNLWKSASPHWWKLSAFILSCALLTRGTVFGYLVYLFQEALSWLKPCILLLVQQPMECFGAKSFLDHNGGMLQQIGLKYKYFKLILTVCCPHPKL